MNMERMSGAMGRLKSFVGMEDEEEAQEQNIFLTDDLSRQCSLSPQQRMYGFAACLACGLFCTLLTVIVLLCLFSYSTSAFDWGKWGASCILVIDALWMIDSPFVVEDVLSAIGLGGYIVQAFDDPAQSEIITTWWLVLYFYCHNKRKCCRKIEDLKPSKSLLVFLSPIKFAVTFTFGNMLSLGSTAFLIGPMRQLNMMFDPVRIVASAVFLGSIAIALFCALYIHSKLLTLLAIIIEFCALIWYSLSYIPFARAAAKKFLGACFDEEF